MVLKRNYDGIAGRTETVSFRKRFMRKGNKRTGNHNHLFGTAYGQEIGICTDSSFSCRNTNAVIIGTAEETEQHYLIPNLLSAHSSAVLLDFDFHILPCNSCLDNLKQKGIVYYLCYPEEVSETIIKQLAGNQTYLFTNSRTVVELLFQKLYQYAESDIPHKNDQHYLPYPVHFYLNNSDSCLHMEKLPLILSTCRRYGIGVSIFTESIKKLKEISDDIYETALNCCDTELFFSAETEDDTILIDNLAGGIYTDSKGTPVSKIIAKYPNAMCVNISPVIEKRFLPPDIQTKVFQSGKIILFVRDCYPMLCSKLKRSRRL